MYWICGLVINKKELIVIIFVFQLKYLLKLVIQCTFSWDIQQKNICKVGSCV